MLHLLNRFDNEKNGTILSISFDRLQIHVAWQDIAYPIHINGLPLDAINVSYAALKCYLPTLVKEIGIYPSCLLKKSNLRQIVLNTSMTYNCQRRAALPDYQHKTLFLDTSFVSQDSAYAKQVIHHDYFHLLDFFCLRNFVGDRAWKMLNNPHFKYGRGGCAMQDDYASGLLTHNHPGFLTKYSTSAIEEDKAELFSHLIMNYAYVKQRATEDKVIEAKVALLKRSLFTACPEINDAFWIKRLESYR